MWQGSRYKHKGNKTVIQKGVYKTMKNTILKWVIEWGGDSCIQEVDETTNKIINTYDADFGSVYGALEILQKYPPKKQIRTLEALFKYFDELDNK